MDELQRQHYLKSMGVEVYYARFQLPGARPSPHYQLAEPHKHEPASTERSDSHQAQARSAEQPASGHAGQSAAPLAHPGQSQAATAPEKTAAQVAKASAKSNPESSDAAELRFSLQYFAINSSLAIINEHPHQLRSRESRDVMTLLKAILAALLPAGEAPQLTPMVFDWPIAEGLSATDPKRAAALAIKGFVNQRQAQDGFQHLLVFAAQVQSLLGSQSEHAEFGHRETSELNCQLTVTHSLQSMLVHPLLKREVWSHLQVLQQRLGQ